MAFSEIVAELFHVEIHTINYHIKEIFKSGELEEIATTRKFRVVLTLIVISRNTRLLARIS